MTTSIYHYVYRITNTKSNTHYYGSRSSKCHPSKDLGVLYFSSSSDKEFILDQETNPTYYKYKIIKCFDSREYATEYEIFLHEYFNVKNHPSFYNQTSSGFHTQGYKHTANALEKMSKAKKGKPNISFKGKHHTEESKRLIGIKSKQRWANNPHPMKGKSHSLMTRKKMSKSGKGKRQGSNNGMFDGYYITPLGKFDTINDIIADKFNVSKVTLWSLCKDPHKVISSHVYNKSTFFKSLGRKEDIVGELSSVIGFSFEVVS